MTDTNILIPDDPFDLDISAVPEEEREIKAVPSGRYRFNIIAYEAATNPRNGNRGIDYKLQLVEPLEGQDIEGIPVDRINFNHVFWVTHNSAPVVASIHRRLNRNLVGSIKEFPEQMVGVSLIGVLESTTADENGEALKWPRYRIVNVYPSQ